MKPIKAFSAAVILCVWAGQTAARQVPAIHKSTALAAKPSEAANQTSAQDRQNLSAANLIAQGKALFRAIKLRQALAKFEAALKQEPDNDEALGLAAETAFRLDDQTAARKYLQRRAELTGQKDSVKAFCFQRVAMAHWREAHDLAAKSAEIKQGKVVYALPEDALKRATEGIHKGIEYAARAIEVRDDYSDAYNIRNLLHAEAALIGEEKAQEHRQKSLEDLRMALAMASPAPDSKNDIADFNYPTIRIAEFARTRIEDGQLEDPMMKEIEGGKVLKRVPAVFPSARPKKPAGDTNEPSAKSAKPNSGVIKVEVLVSTEGKVIFTHMVEGRSELSTAAILAARSWTFEPATLDSQPVQLSGVISFDIKPSAAKPAPPAAKTTTQKP